MNIILVSKSIYCIHSTGEINSTPTKITQSYNYTIKGHFGCIGYSWHMFVWLLVTLRLREDNPLPTFTSISQNRAYIGVFILVLQSMPNPELYTKLPHQRIHFTTDQHGFYLKKFYGIEPVIRSLILISRSPRDPHFSIIDTL